MSTLSDEITIIPSRKPAEPKGYHLNSILENSDVIWSPHTVHLYQPGRATIPSIRTMNGTEFLEYATVGGHLIGVHALDYVLEHPGVYLEEWKPLIDGKFRTVFFCGTTFVDDRDVLGIAGLQYDPEMERLERICRSVKADFGINCFAASPYPY